MQGVGWFVPLAQARLWRKRAMLPTKVSNESSSEGRITALILPRFGRNRARSFAAVIAVATLALAGCANGSDAGSDQTVTPSQSTSESTAPSWDAQISESLGTLVGMEVTAVQAVKEDDNGRSQVSVSLRNDQEQGLDVVIVMAKSSAAALEQVALTEDAIRGECETSTGSCVVLDTEVQDDLPGPWMSLLRKTDDGSTGFSENFWPAADEFVSITYLPVGVKDTQDLVPTEKIGKWLKDDAPRPWDV